MTLSLSFRVFRFLRAGAGFLVSPSRLPHWFCSSSHLGIYPSHRIPDSLASSLKLPLVLLEREEWKGEGEGV